VGFRLNTVTQFLLLIIALGVFVGWLFAAAFCGETYYSVAVSLCGWLTVKFYLDSRVSLCCVGFHYLLD
jgi:hypothetical protein